ncbi:MAG: GGDEF domain-containing protein [Leucobacter sp.]
MRAQKNGILGEVGPRWLPGRWLKHFIVRTPIFTVVTAGVVLLFGLLGALELFETDITSFEVWLSIGILLVCLSIGVIVLLGVELPFWLGFGMIAAHALVSVYYLGFSDERQNAIAALQELPIMAIYFSWFFGARIARAGEFLILIAVSAALILGPFWGNNGLLGPANLIGAVLFTWLGLEASLFVRKRLRHESHTDDLTGVLNRRGFLAEARRELHRASREGCTVSIALLDLDEFKSINDGSGHAAGDAVLRTLTSQWMTLSRPADIVGRLGGDEFVILLPGAELNDAMAVMRRLRAPAAHPWSWGVTQMNSGETLESALQRADRAMYEHKRIQSESQIAGT